MTGGWNFCPNPRHATVVRDEANRTACRLDVSEPVSNTSPVIVWFREDLRLSDNPALSEAAATGAPLICLYVFDETAAARPPGAASRWWLAQSLRALDADLRKAGSALVLRKGTAARTIAQVARSAGASAVFWNRIHSKSEAASADAARKVVEAVEHRRTGVVWRPAGRAGTHSRIERRRHARVHAVLETRAGARRSAKAPARAEATCGRTEDQRRPPGGLEAGADGAGLGRRPASDVEARRGRRLHAAEGVPRRESARLREQPRPAGPGRDIAPVTAPALRRNQPAAGLVRRALCRCAGRRSSQATSTSS